MSAGGYERTDADPARVLRWLTRLALTIVAVLAIAKGLYDRFPARYGEPAVAASPPASYQANLAAPLLQVDPEADMAALREAEDARLGSYGWVDRKAGRLRIPVARAMELLARRGRSP